jgi:hypothetical protein
MRPSLRQVSRRIWLLVGGGGLLFIATALALAVRNPATPANELVNRRTAWLFLPSIVMVAAGIYVSLRYWRCPYCGRPLRTSYPIPRDCPGCGRDVGIHAT